MAERLTGWRKRLQAKRPDGTRIKDVYAIGKDDFGREVYYNERLDRYSFDPEDFKRKPKEFVEAVTEFVQSYGKKE